MPPTADRSSQVALGVGVCRTGHVAREVGVPRPAVDEADLHSRSLAFA
jgi:hypothetical protein